MIFSGKPGPWRGLWTRLGRGDIRLLILEALRKRPMHGYEVAKEISRVFGGLYEPSPGAVYPTLQWLEDEGYVKVVQDNGKRVYSITEQGLKFLQDRRESVDKLMKSCHQLMDSEKTQLFTAGRKLAQTLMILWTEGNEEKLREATAILEEARKKLAELTLR